MTKRCFDLGWMERMKRSHAIIVAPCGRRCFREALGIGASDRFGCKIAAMINGALR